MTMENPYGSEKFGGITLPDYYRPTPSVQNRNNYVPQAEPLGADEMRISFMGSTPYPPQRDQAGTCIFVELGNGDNFFFDFGSGCMRNIFAMGIPVQTINDIFLTHLHVDHYADLPYLLPFSAWQGRWKPLRVYGPSGRTPELGTKAMVKGMKEMLRWHLEAFDTCPIGDGYEIDVTEYDWKDEYGICYEKNGVTVRHWRRSHAKDGASAYRLDWNGLSFVWTGDGRPDELTVKYAQGVDVLVSEGQIDTIRLQHLKYGVPPELMAYTLDIHHTPYYAAGYLFKETNPRVGMMTHMELDDDTMGEAITEIRSHWDGLYLWGGPDVAVVNVTKDAVWSRMSLLAEHTGVNMPTPEQFAKVFQLDKDNPPAEIKFPEPKLPREEQQEQETRDNEIDPEKYYPPTLDRPILTHWPSLSINIEQMKKARKKRAA